MQPIFATQTASISELKNNPSAMIKQSDGESIAKKLQQRLSNPHVPASKLSGHTDTYKIKLRTIGYRLVYTVKDDVVVVYVLAVGKRENNKVYDSLATCQP